MRKKVLRTGNRFHAPLRGRIPLARALYSEGLSGRQIAVALSVSKTWVQENVMKPRDRSTAGILRRRYRRVGWLSKNAKETG